jgi:hypothetical protein
MMTRPPRTADADSLVELLGAVAEAIDPATAEAAYPNADPGLLCVLVVERVRTVAGALWALLEHRADLGRRARVLARLLRDLDGDGSL